MAVEWVAVSESEEDDPVEISAEPDGTLLLTSVTAQFPGSTGLRFRNPDTGGFRGVRCQEGVLHPPSEEEGWGTGVVYYCVRPKVAASGQKRKLEEDAATGVYGPMPPDPKLSAYAGSKSPHETTDLIVLGLPFKTTEEQVRDYFTEFAEGELAMCQLKKHNTGKSRGYAFIRFKNIDTQKKALQQRHLIDERWCDLRIPESQEGSSGRSEDCKIFVARLSELITEEDLKEHFGKFGEVTDVFYPKTPFKGFAFVSFVEAKVAQSLIGMDHVIKGISIQINGAHQKSRSHQSTGGQNPPPSVPSGHQGHPGHGAGDYGAYYGSYGAYGGGGGAGGYGGYGVQGGKGPAAGGPPPPPPPGTSGAPPGGWRPGVPASTWGGQHAPWGGPPPPSAYPGYPSAWESSPSTYNPAAYHNKSGASSGASGAAGGAGAAGNPYGSRPGGGYY